MTKHLTDGELNAILHTAKAQAPEGAIVALFVFQDGGDAGTITDYVSNTETRTLAHVLRDWGRRIINGELTVTRDPRGGVTH